MSRLLQTGAAGLLAVLTCIAVQRPLSPATAASPFKTVFVVMMENHSYNQVIGAADAPYINSLVSGANDTQVSYASNDTPGQHPSEPNYVWLEGGSPLSTDYTNTNTGLPPDWPGDGNPTTANSASDTNHLTTQLNNAGINWKAYVEDDPTPNGCPLNANGLYASRHVGELFFQDVTNNLDPNSAYCTAHVRPFTELGTDLSNNTVAPFNTITPNLCSDMHNTCAPQNDSVKQGDDWLAAHIPTIMASQAYTNNGVILIIWDESANPPADQRIPIIAISPLAKGHGYNGIVPYTHSSELRFIDEIFGVTPQRWAATSNDISDLFQQSPTVAPRRASLAVTHRAGDTTIRWQLADTRDLAGFILSSHGRRLDRAVIPTHRAAAYTYRVRGSVRGPIHLSGVRKDGSIVALGAISL